MCACAYIAAKLSPAASYARLFVGIMLTSAGAAINMYGAA